MLKSWKTTVAGLLLALSTILPSLTSPKDLLKQQNIASLLAAVGLVAAKDHDKSGGA